MRKIRISQKESGRDTEKIIGSEENDESVGGKLFG